MSREEGQILYRGMMWTKVDWKDFSGVLTNHVSEFSRWRAQIFDPWGREVTNEVMPYLSHAYIRHFPVWPKTAIYTRMW